MKKITISIEAMCRCYGPEIMIPACYVLIIQDINVLLILVVEKYVLRRSVDKYENFESNQLIIRRDSEESLMFLFFSRGLINKKKSLMSRSLSFVKECVENKAISAVNVDVLIDLANFVLKTFSVMNGLAITRKFSTKLAKKGTNVLDFGANVDFHVDFFCNLAGMVFVFSAVIDSNPNPRVAFLNTGSEEIKCNSKINYVSKILSKKRF